MDSFNMNIRNNNKSEIIIHPKVASELGMQLVRQSLLRFGMRVSEINLLESEQITENEILISKNIINKLKLPTFCHFSLTYKNKEILFGPLIGIYMGENHDQLIKKLKFYYNYGEIYSEFNGTLFAFSLDYVDKVNLSIKGYIYNPLTDNWEWNELPFPSMILKKAMLTSQWREYFASIYGSKITNFRLLGGKWKIHQRLNEFDEVREYLPPSIKLESIEDLIEFLERHSNVYVKPIGGQNGKGIYKISKTQDGYIVKRRKNNENIEEILNNNSELTEYIGDLIKNNNYIVQKGLSTKFNNKVVDFRITLDKDQSGKYINHLFIAKEGADNSIVSNGLSGGNFKDPFFVLKESYGMNENESLNMKEKLISVSEKLAKYIDLSGVEYSKFAFDLAVDNDLRIWLIEVNIGAPDDFVGAQIGRHEIGPKIRLTNILYGKRLSGFDGQEKEITCKFPDNVRTQKNTMVRKKIYVTGRVQGRGYRTLVQKTAQKYNIVGWIINKKESTAVEIEAEGKNTNINQFIDGLKNVNHESNIKVRSIGTDVIKPKNEEVSFKYINQLSSNLVKTNET